MNNNKQVLLIVGVLSLIGYVVLAKNEPELVKATLTIIEMFILLGIFIIYKILEDAE
jgi:ascorbate-specific PTS system EIIC-type component UlaA